MENIGCCDLKSRSPERKTKTLLTVAVQGEMQVILWVDSQEEFKFHSSGFNRGGEVKWE